MSIVDPLVEDYLRRLDRAAAVLPPDRRSDLVEEIGEHIATARATGAGDDEAAVRTVLDRLGEPEEIVAAAHEDVGWGAPPPPAGRAWAEPPPLVPQPRGTGLELAAVLLLTAGSVIPVVGWLVGVVLLWTSSLWRVREKLLGTLVVPFGPGVVLYGAPLLLGAVGRVETCATSPGFVEGAPAPVGPPSPDALPPDVVGEPPALPDLQYATDGGVTMCEVTGTSWWVTLPLALVLVVAPLVVAVVLLRIARRRAAQTPPTMTPALGVAPSPWGPLEISAVLLLGLGGFLVPVVGALVGLALACVSRRWTVTDKLVAGVLALTPAALTVVSFVLPAAGYFPFPGGWEAFLLLLVTGPVAAVYLAVVLSRRAAAPTPPAGTPQP